MLCCRCVVSSLLILRTFLIFITYRHSFHHLPLPFQPVGLRNNHNNQQQQPSKLATYPTVDLLRSHLFARQASPINHVETDNPHELAVLPPTILALILGTNSTVVTRLLGRKQLIAAYWQAPSWISSARPRTATTFQPFYLCDIDDPNIGEHLIESSSTSTSTSSYHALLPHHRTLITTFNASITTIA